MTHFRPYAIITAEKLDYTEDSSPLAPSFHVIAGDPFLHDGGDRPQPEPFTLADDDGIVYFHGYIHDDHADDTSDIWEVVFEWGQSHSGTTVLAAGHQDTQCETHPQFGLIATGTFAINDQVIS